MMLPGLLCYKRIGNLKTEPMKSVRIFFFALAACAGVSCIQDEALNSEAAIDAVTGANIQLANIDAANKRINIYVPRQNAYAQQELIFTLADEATIAATPAYASDDVAANLYDFSGGDTRRFTVTSEDGTWKTVYDITLVNTELPLEYSFDDLLEGSSAAYDIFVEEQNILGEDNSRVLQWVSGNPGYELTGMAKSRTDYPTVQVAEGHTGRCVKLETRETGSFGMSINPRMPIAAGNIFVGSFDLSYALTDARAATKFGFPFYQQPERLQGYYKFRAGDVFTDANGDVVADRRDKCDIYAVLYEVDSNTDFLDGDNSLTSPDIVLMARIPQEEIVEGDEWIYFDEPFEKPEGGSKTFDAAGLEEGRYKLAIVCSSSVRGAYFEGAVGSTLYVDDLRLICRP